MIQQQANAAQCKLGCRLTEFDKECSQVLTRASILAHLRVIERPAVPQQRHSKGRKLRTGSQCLRELCGRSCKVLVLQDNVHHSANKDGVVTVAAALQRGTQHSNQLDRKGG